MDYFALYFAKVCFCSSSCVFVCLFLLIFCFFFLLREEHRAQARKKVAHCIIEDESPQDNAVVTPKPVAPVETPGKEPDDTEVPPSVAILFAAHEFLGPKGWCLTSSGELLHFMLDTVVYRLDTPMFENLREKMDIHVEQALFCLYQHPSKKNKVF